MSHTQHPLNENKPSILIGLLDNLKPEVVWIDARTNVTTKLAAKKNKKKEGIPPEKLVPGEFHNYLDVSSETEANQFSEERTWIIRLRWRKDLNQNHSGITT